MIHSLRFAVCSLHQYHVGEQSRIRIPFQPQKLGSVVVAQGATDRRKGLDARRYESDFLSQLGSVPLQHFDKPSRVW
jgi:hypothetical protein